MVFKVNDHKLFIIFGNVCNLCCSIHREDELPLDVRRKSDSGLKIKFYKHELIESCDSSNIKLNEICGKCTVLKAHENDSVTETLARSNKKYPMAYVCRYRLVIEKNYKLVPVSWVPGEEEIGGEISDADGFTDAEDHNENVCNLSATINELHLSLIEGNRDKLVSPIKIVNKSVQKVPRIRNQLSPSKKRTSPDAKKPNNDVSPNKRSKPGSDYESPNTRGGKIASPAQKEMNKIRKNLNDSFNDAELDDDPKSPFYIKDNAPLKITLAKGRPLREHNDNETPTNKLQNKRLSILKNW